MIKIYDSQVVPAIIPETIEEIETKLSLVKGLPKGLVKKVQLDFVDGKYAPPITWPFSLNHEPDKGFKLPYSEDIILEADLFIKHPEDWIDDFLRVGIRSFVIHLDSTKYLDKCIHLIKSQGGALGLGIKPSGDMALLEEYVSKADFVQFMGNDRVGYNGVELDRKVLRTIAEFHANHFSVPIQIDIGVNEDTAAELIRSGVTLLVADSAVIGEEHPATSSKQIEEKIAALLSN